MTRLVYSTGGEVETPTTAAAPRTRGDGVRIRLERRASSRSVTVVSGVPGTPRELAELVRHLKAVCGVGGTVKAGVLELQGDQRARVEAELASRGLRSKRAGG